MAIFQNHIQMFSDMLAVPGFLSEPFLALGVQYFGQIDNPDFHFPNLNAYLRAHGIQKLDELDPFDEAANLRWNLNYAVPETAHEHYATVLDIGCVEHIFDTRMVFENCLRMVRVGGLYGVHAPICGHANHGLHTFHSELVPRLFAANGFELVYLKYTTQKGLEFVPDSGARDDAIVWAVGRKTRPLLEFHKPEQSMYSP